MKRRPSWTAWRENLEETLPNLLKPADVTRLERLLVRFVSVVPKEYHNGVDNGQVTIPLEYQEAVQFVQQAQGLVNELGARRGGAICRCHIRNITPN